MAPGSTLNDSMSQMASILEASTESVFLERLKIAAIECGFEHALIALQWQDPQGETRYRVCSGYPEAWQRIYLERAYKDIDPAVAHCKISTEPLLWTTELFAKSNSLPLLEAARKYGLGHGISIPTHEALGIKSMVCVARSRPIEPHSPEATQLLRTAKVLATFAHRAFRHLTKEDLTSEPLRPLSEQEVTCLRWVATGKTSWEVGKILDISESTAIFHIKNVMEKLGVKSRAHAIAVAFRIGLLS